MKKTFSILLLACLLVGFLTVGHLPLFDVAAATLEGGDITQDTVWTVADSPYLLVSDVTVKNGTTLTIEPGVTVESNEDVVLNVEGSLLANGSSSDRIVFTLNSSMIDEQGFSAGQWTGLKFVGASTESFVLEFVDVKYAKNGITIESLGEVTIENAEITENAFSGIHIVGEANTIIKDNAIHLNKNGISTEGNLSSGIEIINNGISDNENGIYIHTSDLSICRIYNVTILNNYITQNENGIYIFSNASTNEKEAHINGVVISSNTVSRGNYGVCLRTSGVGYIYNSTISSNTVSFNEKGIDIYSGSNLSSWISNVTVSENKVFSNINGISAYAYRADASPIGDLPFDITMIRNIVSANNDTGIEILGDVRANFTENSVSFNSYGISLSSQSNWARRSDIYKNSLYGMYVKGNATIDAVYNYWGNADGPYHQTLRPDSQGDKINGDGVNLDFYPFLVDPVGYINEAPIANIGVSETSVLVNHAVVIDAVNSTDDTSIINYFYDFGDGESKSGYLSVVRHEYSIPGVYYVRVIVMDEFGVLSEEAIETVSVTLPFLTVDVLLMPPSVSSKGEVSVRVHVTNGSAAVEGVIVQLESDEGGNLSPSSGLTNLNGDFNSTYTSPEVLEPITVTITVNASQKGYINASRQAYLPVLVPRSNGTLFGSLLFWTVAIAAAIVIVAAVFVSRKKKR